MKKVIIIILLIFPVYLFSQQVQDALNHEISSVKEKALYKKNSNFHTSIRPFYHKEVQEEVNNDSIVDLLKRDNRLYLTGGSWWAKVLRWSENKLLDDNFIQDTLETFKIKINPILNLATGKDRISNFNTWQNTRGIILEGELGEKLSFSTSFYESQALLMPYMSVYMNNTFIVPGQGRYKLFKLGPAVDYGFSEGNVTYKANKTFTFQLGQGRNFLGDGYRSLLLSDNAFNYPFFKVETKFWNIKYVNLFAQLNHMGFSSAEDRLFDRKYFAIQYLSWNITKRLNISFFEMVTWKSVPTRNFDFNYINPIVFLRPVEFQNGSLDKMMLGLTGKFKLTNSISLYGQFVLDDLRISEFKNGTNWWGNKYGFQGGIKAFDLFKIRGLSAQVEYNQVRPYTYSHLDSITAYTQLNQPLAHPLGANFKEGVGFLRYNYKRHFVQLRVSQAIFGLDTANINHGQNIFLSYNTNKVEIEGENGEFGHKTLQGLKTKLDIVEFKYAYLLNPSSNLMLEVGITNRTYNNTNINNNTQHVFIGLKTSLSNIYYDFL